MKLRQVDVRIACQRMQSRKQLNSVMRLNMMQTIAKHFQQSMQNPPSLCVADSLKQGTNKPFDA